MEHASTCRTRGEGGLDFRKRANPIFTDHAYRSARAMGRANDQLPCITVKPSWLGIIAFAGVDRGAISALSFALFPHQAHPFSRRAARSSISTALCRAVFRALSQRTAW